MEIRVGDKIKTKLFPMACSLKKPEVENERVKTISYHHKWRVTGLDEHVIYAEDKAGITTKWWRKDGRGIDWDNHFIYKNNGQ